MCVFVFTLRTHIFMCNASLLLPYPSSHTHNLTHAHAYKFLAATTQTHTNTYTPTHTCALGSAQWQWKMHLQNTHTPTHAHTHTNACTHEIITNTYINGYLFKRSTREAMPSAGRQRFTRGDNFDLLEKRIFLFSILLFSYFPIFLSGTLFWNDSRTIQSRRGYAGRGWLRLTLSLTEGRRWDKRHRQRGTAGSWICWLKYVIRTSMNTWIISSIITNRASDHYSKHSKREYHEPHKDSWDWQDWGLTLEALPPRGGGSAECPKKDKRRVRHGSREQKHTEHTSHTHDETAVSFKWNEPLSNVSDFFSNTVRLYDNEWDFSSCMIF